MKETVATWVGTGPNKPISAEQIQQVLGNQKGCRSWPRNTA
jgi:uncharacterized protein YidB (DUF937 family)